MCPRCSRLFMDEQYMKAVMQMEPMHLIDALWWYIQNDATFTDADTRKKIVWYLGERMAGPP